MIRVFDQPHSAGICVSLYLSMFVFFRLCDFPSLLCAIQTFSTVNSQVCEKADLSLMSHNRLICHLKCEQNTDWQQRSCLQRTKHSKCVIYCIFLKRSKVSMHNWGQTHMDIHIHPYSIKMYTHTCTHTYSHTPWVALGPVHPLSQQKHF